MLNDSHPAKKNYEGTNGIYNGALERPKAEFLR
jgi:hypothetical protein